MAESSFDNATLADALQLITDTYNQYAPTPMRHNFTPDYFADKLRDSADPDRLLASWMHQAQLFSTPVDLLDQVPTEDQILSSIKSFRPSNAADEDSLALSILGALGGLLGGGGSGRSSTNQVSNETTNTTLNETTQTRQYVDVQTPEEFLDDFETGFSTYLQEQLSSGIINSRDYNFLVESRTGLKEALLTEYIGHLGQMAAEGQQIFEVVGQFSNTKSIGNRPGADSTVNRDSSSTSEATRDTTYLDTGETTHDTNKQTSRNTEQARSTETENIFSRNRLAVVASLSPATFLQRRFNGPGGLSTWIQDQKGVKLRTIETQSDAPGSNSTRTAPLVS